MANNDYEITVSVEAAVHAAVKKLAEQIYKDHKIMINDLDIEWMKIQVTDGGSHVVVGIQARTSTRC